MSLETIFKSPLKLILSALYTISWVIALGGLISIKTESALCWFCLIYVLFVLVYTLVILFTNSLKNYHLSLIAYLSIGLVFCVLAFQNLNEIEKSSIKVKATVPYAGFGLLVISLFITLIALGKSPEEDIEEDTNKSVEKQNSSQNNEAGNFSDNSKYSNPARPDSFSNIVGTSSGNPFGGTMLGGTILGGTDTLNYQYRAKATYAYVSQDSNELSFAKGDELEIADKEGKWWQARSKDGKTGIVPSNYLQII
ncbi:hypothetical protein K502DRAFT_366810 [Neoconidiobolus thromboides FSU 785]|nr:hypothetical protein K502DRAFT_366810 [Neoconidiobolus thromboides FSU 785]